MTSSAAPPEDLALRIHGLNKSFGSNQVLGDVAVSVRRGEVMALLGENGSGKSTLIKIVSGVLSGDSGVLQVGGVEVDATDVRPDIARAAGVRVVHQDPGLFAPLSVLDNFAVATPPPQRRIGSIRWRPFRDSVRATLRRYGLDLDLDTPVGRLAAVDRSLLAIARALHGLRTDDDAADGAALLILDEPTASLPEAEVGELLDRLRRVRDSGLGIVFVTHRFDEVLSLADRALVLRGGRCVADRSLAGVDADDLYELIVGSAPASAVDRESAPRATRATRLKLRDVGPVGADGASLEVAQGEIVGLAGLAGCGASELLRATFGATPRGAGDVVVDGTPIAPGRPAESIRHGVAYVPADRNREGSFRELDVGENLAITALRQYYRGGRLRKAVIQGDGRDLLDRFDVVPRDPGRLMATLSGGNQQRVVLARWMRLAPGVILLDEPTQGVDVRSRSAIHQMIRRNAAAGAAVLVASSDLDELAAVCDRIVIMSRGQLRDTIVGPFDADTINRGIFAVEAAHVD